LTYLTAVFSFDREIVRPKSDSFVFLLMVKIRFVDMLDFVKLSRTGMAEKVTILNLPPTHKEYQKANVSTFLL